MDKFKSINDILGHDAGDQVLKVIGTRLTGTVRAIDMLARVGGDGFISVMMVTGHMEGTSAIAKIILDSFAEPLSIPGHELHLSTSIGIAIHPEDAEDLENLTTAETAAVEQMLEESSIRGFPGKSYDLDQVLDKVQELLHGG